MKPLRQQIEEIIKPHLYPYYNDNDGEYHDIPLEVTDSLLTAVREVMNGCVGNDVNSYVVLDHAIIEHFDSSELAAHDNKIQNQLRSQIRQKIQEATQ